MSKSPTAGSFVRPTRKSDAPRSFVEALRQKYASEDFEDPDVEIVYVRADKRKPVAARDKPIRISGKEVEEIGFDKIRKQLADLHELKVVLLDGLCMSRPVASLKEMLEAEGESSWLEGLTDIKETCPKIIELDLSRNLFEEWREVASICEQLDKLRSLRVEYVTPCSYRKYHSGCWLTSLQWESVQRHKFNRSRTSSLHISLYARQSTQA
jgi:hypothetical protein